VAERKSDMASELASLASREVFLSYYVKEMFPSGSASELDKFVVTLSDSIPGFLGDLLRVLNTENLAARGSSPELSEDGDIVSPELMADPGEERAQDEAAALPSDSNAGPVVVEGGGEDSEDVSPSTPVTVNPPAAPVRGRLPFNEVSRLPKPRIFVSNDTDIRAVVAANLTASWLALPPERRPAFLVDECAPALARLEESLSTEEFVKFVVTLTAKWELPDGAWHLLRHLRRILDNVPDGQRGDPWDETLLLLARYLWAAQVVKSPVVPPETWMALAYLHELLVRAAVVAVPINTVADAAELMLEVLHSIGQIRNDSVGADIRGALAILSIARNIPKSIPTAFDLAVLPTDWADVVMACGQGQVLEALALPRAAQLWLWSAAILTLAGQRHYEQMVRSTLLFCHSDTGGAKELKMLLAAYAVSQAVKHCGGIGTPLARDSVGALFTALKSISETGPVNDAVLEDAARLYGQVIAGFDRDLAGAESWRRQQRPAVQAVWRAEVPPIPKGNDPDGRAADSIIYFHMMPTADNIVLTPQVFGSCLSLWLGKDFGNSVKEELRNFFEKLRDNPAVTSELVQKWYGVALQKGPLVGTDWPGAKNWAGFEYSCKLDQPGPEVRHSITAAFRQLYGRG